MKRSFYFVIIKIREKPSVVITTTRESRFSTTAIVETEEVS